MPITVYQCGKCRKLYQHEDDAIQCERSHNEVLGCVSYYGYGEQYPQKVRLSFLDGHTREYQMIPVSLDQQWHEMNVERRQNGNKKPTRLKG